MASLPIRDRTAISPISLPPEFPPLASTIQRPAATHDPFTALLPSTLPTHSAAPPLKPHYYTISMLENSFAYGFPADFALTKAASPPTDRVASHGAPADNEKQLRRLSRRYIHEHGVPNDKTCKLRRHAGKRHVTFLFLAT